MRLGRSLACVPERCVRRAAWDARGVRLAGETARFLETSGTGGFFENESEAFRTFCHVAVVMMKKKTSRRFVVAR